jgi:hypothetical protein
MQPYSGICSKSHHWSMQYLSDAKTSLKYIPQIDVIQCYQICMNVVIHSHLISMAFGLCYVDKSSIFQSYFPRTSGVKTHWSRWISREKTISRGESIIDPNLNSVSNRKIFSLCHIEYSNSMAKGKMVQFNWR